MRLPTESMLPQHTDSVPHDLAEAKMELQDVCFWHHQGELRRNLPTIFPHSRTYQIEDFHHLPFSADTHVLLVIADDRLGVDPHACRKPSLQSRFHLHLFQPQPSRQICPCPPWRMRIPLLSGFNWSSQIHSSRRTSTLA